MYLNLRGIPGVPEPAEGEYSLAQHSVQVDSLKRGIGNDGLVAVSAEKLCYECCELLPLMGTAQLPLPQSLHSREQRLWQLQLFLP